MFCPGMTSLPSGYDAAKYALDERGFDGIKNIIVYKIRSGFKKEGAHGLIFCSESLNVDVSHS